MTFRMILPVALLSSLSLISCGGGGGESGPTFTAQPRIAIDSSNSTEVVSEATGSVDNNVFGTIGGGLRADGSVNSNRFNLFRFVAKYKSDQNVALRTETESCTGGGSVTINFNDAGTSGSITFNGCIEDGVTLSGGLSFSGGETSGTISFNSFLASGEEFSMSANGQMTFSSQEFVNYDRFVMNGSSMVMSVSYQGRSITVGNFNATLDDYYFDGYEKYDYNYEVNSAELGGSFAVKTTQSLLISYFQSYPYEGQIEISGAAGSKVLATSMGGDATDFVLIETDADGDGVYESSTTKTWAEIESEASLLN